MDGQLTNDTNATDIKLQRFQLGKGEDKENIDPTKIQHSTSF